MWKLPELEQWDEEGGKYRWWWWTDLAGGEEWWMNEGWRGRTSLVLVAVQVWPHSGTFPQENYYGSFWWMDPFWIIQSTLVHMLFDNLMPDQYLIGTAPQNWKFVSRQLKHDQSGGNWSMWTVDPHNLPFFFFSFLWVGWTVWMCEYASSSSSGTIFELRVSLGG